LLFEREYTGRSVGVPGQSAGIFPILGRNTWAILAMEAGISDGFGIQIGRAGTDWTGFAISYVEKGTRKHLCSPLIVKIDIYLRCVAIYGRYIHLTSNYLKFQAYLYMCIILSNNHGQITTVVGYISS
jgi:hypothetical protein